MAAKKAPAIVRAARAGKGRAQAAKKPGAARKKAARRVEPRPLLADHAQVRSVREDLASIEFGAALQRSAMEWSYVLRNRRRWADREASREEQAERSRALLDQLGIEPERMRAIASAGLVEVSVPFVAEEVGWEARVFPWEYALSGATRAVRRGLPLTVVRHLDRLGRRSPRPRSSIERLLFVEAAPCGLRAGFSFDSERKLVQSNLGLAARGVRILEDPTRLELEQAVKELAPDVVHLTGFDTHQGLTELGLQDGDEAFDGILLRETGGKPDPVAALDLARLVNSAQTKPFLVACNLFDSAARTAALCVAEGARAAVGFQDRFDDSLTELFFAHFYRELPRLDWNEHRAFLVAWKELRNAPQGLAGTGVVLWSSRSIRETPEVAAAQGDGRPRARAAPPGRKPRAAARTLAPAPVAETPSVAPAAIGDLVSVEVKPLERLNYSMLHNNRPLFESLILRKFVPQRMEDVSVGVELHVGTDSYPFRMSLDLDAPVHDLNRLVRVPLTSALGRSVRESVHTSLFVEVTWKDNVLYRNTHRVTLLPVDEWRDDDSDRIWLPSFVLPRDPAVARIVDAAQRYLMTLLDDSGAGFDGYQSYDPEAEDPGEAIDLQVQAMWAALSYELPLSYINPPPTYTSASQRLRTPSQVIDGRRGTCIDLALLVASCLEYVDIYPVIFLLEGHAFPGYWRSEEAHERFQRVDLPESAVAAGAPSGALRSSGPQGQRYAWYFEKEHYGEIVELVRAREIVPMESVWLTHRGGFWDAIDEGTKNLRSKREFSGMLDVVVSRDKVTPLPIREERG
jgi:hypothetical protein